MDLGRTSSLLFGYGKNRYASQHKNCQGLFLGSGERWTSAAVTNELFWELSCIIHHSLLSLGSAGGSSQSSLSYTSTTFKGLKQAQASTEATLSLHLQANVGQSAALLTRLRLFRLANRSHATKGSYAGDTCMHSCWKMKLQVGKCLVSRVLWLAVYCRNAVKPFRINMRQSSLLGEAAAGTPRYSAP